MRDMKDKRGRRATAPSRSAPSLVPRPLILVLVVPSSSYLLTSKPIDRRRVVPLPGSEDGGRETSACSASRG